MERKENKNVPAIDVGTLKTQQAAELLLYSLKNTDGSINEEELKKFLLQVVEQRQNASRVYSEVTKGLLKEWHYPSETVLSVFHNLQKNMVDKSEVCADMLHLVQDEHTKQLMLEYFGKIY